MEWQTMETAPKDGTPILCWVDPKAYPSVLETGKLTSYSAHAEWLGQVKKGFHICSWGGEYVSQEGEYSTPAWWFVHSSDFEVVASPIRWMPLPEPPDQNQNEWIPHTKNTLPTSIEVGTLVDVQFGDGFVVEHVPYLQDVEGLSRDAGPLFWHDLGNSVNSTVVKYRVSQL